MKIKGILTTLVIIVLIVGMNYFLSQHPSPLAQQQSVESVQTSNPPFGQRTKTSGCQPKGALPDASCTPGLFDPSLTRDVLCNATFTTKSIRNVPLSEKDAVYSEYGIVSHQPGEYEVDHVISLELGGSNDIANLWPEAAEPRPGFHEKDLVENYLHKQVCSGAISLQDAQQKIATNWLQVYQSVPHIQNYGYTSSRSRQGY